MKHIKTKEVYSVEDYLLEFEDSGEIYNLVVSNVGVADLNILKVKFDFNSELVGLKKLEVLDKIISRLSRKYHCVIADNTFFIDLTKLDKDYINYSLVEWANNILKDKLSGLNVYTSYTGFKSYGKSNDDLILEYSIKSKELYVAKAKLWSFFNNKFMLKYADIAIIIKDAVVNTLQIEVNNITLLEFPINKSF